MLFIQQDNRVIFYVKFTANAGHTGLIGIVTMHDKLAFKLYVKAVREKGKANQAVIDYFANILKTAKKNILIDSGQTQAFKKIVLLNQSLNEVKACFNTLGFIV